MGNHNSVIINERIFTKAKAKFKVKVKATQIIKTEAGTIKVFSKSKSKLIKYRNTVQY